MATISDVANRAGVATSTVSYALSGKRPISAETRSRIERAIDELGYRQHAGAKALASAKTDVIGLMAPLRVGVDVNVIMQFVSGIVAEAAAAGYDILLITQDEGALERVVRSSMVDAVVVMDVEAADPRVPQLVSLDTPSVLIGLPTDPQGLSCVDLDFAQGGATAARHLIELGHQSVALLGSPDEVVSRHTSYAVRLTEGFKNTCEQAGVRSVVIPTDSSAEGGRASVESLFEALPDVSAVVVHNELALPHIIAAIRDRGLKIPRDISLLTVSPETTAVSQVRPLSSVDIPAESIGRTSIDMLTAIIDHQAPGEIRLISPHLVDRGSTRAPRAAAVK